MINGKQCILVVDDEAKIVRALSDFFSANGYRIAKAYNGEQAMEVYSDNTMVIDLIIMDVMMPKMNGFDVLKALRKAGHTVPVIMLTAKGEEYNHIKGLNYGSDDYIAKPFSPSLLLARVQALLRRTGKGYVTDLVAGNITVSRLNHTVTDSGNNIDLTKREFDLLCYFMINEKILLSREQLLNSVWGYGFDGDPRTVDTHIKQLRSKLISGNYIKTVYKAGYKFERE